MERGYTAAILGATGAVGEEMRHILERSALPLRELRLLASERSEGRSYLFRGQSLQVRRACAESFRGCDLVFGAVDAPLARRFAPFILEARALFIDNSSAFRLEDEVPLVVPELNGADALCHNGIIANPNCATIIALVAVGGIEREAGIARMIASTYQAVSGAGEQGIAALLAEERALQTGEPVARGPFPYPIARNLIPHIGVFGADGVTAEERKMQREGRKILHRPDLAVSCSCVRVPVMRSHSVSICLETKRKLTAEQAKEIVAASPGCLLVDDARRLRYPVPLEAAGQDAVLVGRIREDPVFENGISLWCSGDQLRKGAAANAVQIAELVAAGRK